jgi:hypothetical protein
LPFLLYNKNGTSSHGRGGEQAIHKKRNKFTLHACMRKGRGRGEESRLGKLELGRVNGESNRLELGRVIRESK